MNQYLGLLKKIMDHGVTVQTGAYLPGEGRQPTARRLFGEQLRFDLAEGFPAVTTKPLWWRAVVAEWIWFLRGSGDGQYLVDQKVDSIWKSWFKEGTTDLGPVYGRQLRKMQGVKWVSRKEWPSAVELLRDGQLLGYAQGERYVYYRSGRYRLTDMGHVFCDHGPVVETDQIANARDDIRAVIANPFNRARRRIIVSLWNPAQVPEMSLPPCHTFHFYDMVPPGQVPYITGNERPDEIEAWQDRRWTLNLHLVARSIDAVKGLPFNVASYALMLSVMAKITDCKPGELLITFNDVHIYDNQFSDVEEQMTRTPFAMPKLAFVPNADGVSFDHVCKDLSIAEAHDLTPEMFKLEGYKSHPRLKSESEVAV